jgi:hypothetical protein
MYSPAKMDLQMSHERARQRHYTINAKTVRPQKGQAFPL